MESPPLPPGYDLYSRPRPTYQFTLANPKSDSPPPSTNHSRSPSSGKSSFLLIPAAPDVDIMAVYQSAPLNPTSNPTNSPVATKESLDHKEKKSRRKAAVIDQNELSKVAEELEAEVNVTEGVEEPINLSPLEALAPPTPDPVDPNDFHFASLLTKPLLPEEEAVFRRHRGVSLAEDQLLAKLNDFGDLSELNLNLDADQDQLRGK